MHYKGKSFVVVAVIFAIFLLTGCVSDCTIKGNKDNSLSPCKVFNGFSLNCLDVGNGDCDFIKLDDNKFILINTGSERFENYVFNYLNCYDVKKIDYLILTSPLPDYIGGAHYIIENFDVGMIFLPQIEIDKQELFPVFKDVIDLVSTKKIKNEVYNLNNFIKGENYSLAFLSPLPAKMSGSAFDEFNGALVPDSEKINNISPIMILNYKNRRFVLSSSAGVKEEKLVYNNYKSGLYDMIFLRHGINVNLENVDFLKVSCHGVEFGSDNDYLGLLKPENAVISVGEDYYPSTTTIEKIIYVNENCAIYRTDVYGRISVFEKDGKFNIDKESDK